MWPRRRALCLLSRNSTLTLNALRREEDVEVNFSSVCEIVHVIRLNDDFGKLRALQIVSLVADKHCAFISLSIKQFITSFCKPVCSVFTFSKADLIVVFVLSVLGVAVLTLHSVEEFNYFCCQCYTNLMQNQNRYIFLDILFCSIFTSLPYFGEPIGRVKIQTKSKHSQRYYTTKCLIRDLLSNMSNCYVLAGNFADIYLRGMCDRMEWNSCGKSS